MDLVAGRLEADLHTVQGTDLVLVQGEGIIRVDLCHEVHASFCLHLG
jgi:hypothetical protein